MKHSKQRLKLRYQHPSEGSGVDIRTLQRPVSDVSGWKYLKRLGWTLQTPRPQHQAAATADEQQAFKKTYGAGSCA